MLKPLTHSKTIPPSPVVTIHYSTRVPQANQQSKGNPTKQQQISGLSLKMRQQIDLALQNGYKKMRNGDIHEYSEIALDNNVLLTYIHDIYSTYGIPDPIRNNNLRNIQTSFNFDCEKEKNSIGFAKPIGKQNKTARTTQSQILKFSRAKDSKITKLKQSFRRQLEKTAVESQQYQSRFHKVVEQTSSFICNSQNYCPEFLQTTTTPVNSIRLPSSQHFYRYCIVCEQLVQNSNIMQHQQNCEGFFQLLYKLSSLQLYQYLKTKLQRLQGDLIHNLRKPQFEEKNQNNRSQQFSSYINQNNIKNQGNQIEKAIFEFLGCVKNRKDFSVQNLENKYVKVIQVLPKKYMRIMQLSYKIRWFTKVLQQVRERFLVGREKQDDNN